jgi:hypothetical protein
MTKSVQSAAPVVNLLEPNIPCQAWFESSLGTYLKQRNRSRKATCAADVSHRQFEDSSQSLNQTGQIKEETQRRKKSLIFRSTDISKE